MCFRKRLCYDGLFSNRNTPMELAASCAWLSESSFFVFGAIILFLIYWVSSHRQINILPMGIIMALMLDVVVDLRNFCTVCRVVLCP